MLRANFNTRWYARAESCSCRMAVFINSLAILIQFAELPYLGNRHIGVVEDPGPGKTGQLALTGNFHPGLNHLGGFSHSGGCLVFDNPPAGTCTWISILSISGPEMRF